MSDVTCRGSFALGTACGRCSKCKAQIEEYKPKKAARESLDGTAAFKSQIAALQDRLADLETKLGEVEAERDEADRRAGAAEREMVELKDSKQRRNQWLDKAKEERGYLRDVSFDVVWKDTCDKADQVARLTVQIEQEQAFTRLARVRAEVAEAQLATARRDAWNRAAMVAEAWIARKENLISLPDTIRALIAQEEPTT